MNEAARSFRVATWLGWQIESNWTDPFLFAVYSLIRPVASVMILVVMYSVVSGGGRTGEPIFAYIYLGNAFYIYVGSVLTGVSWAVIDDREHYQTLKYLYVSPMRIVAYLMGRAMARMLMATISVLITLLFGVLLLDVPINLLSIDWPLLLVSMVIGLVGLAFLGLILAGTTLMLARHAWMIGEGVAGAFYVFSGAVFPLDFLPLPLRAIGYAIPLAYWLELVRRAMLGATASAFPTFALFSNGQLLAVLTGIGVMSGVVSLFYFRWTEHVARERGLIDRETHH